MHCLIHILVSIVLIQITCACYITNCPIGGKRSVHHGHTPHQCPRCGVNGQCFGPSICCTTSACRMGHPSDVRQCSLENRSLQPCTIHTPTCSAVANGRCAASGVCCNTESCQMDDTCSIPSTEDTDSSRDESPSHSRAMLV